MRSNGFSHISLSLVAANGCWHMGCIHQRTRVAAAADGKQSQGTNRVRTNRTQRCARCVWRVGTSTGRHELPDKESSGVSLRQACTSAKNAIGNSWRPRTTSRNFSAVHGA